jgi:hypothetical protein
MRAVTPAHPRAQGPHCQEKPPCKRRCAGRTELLGDFHVRMAELMGNEVLAQMLGS